MDAVRAVFSSRYAGSVDYYAAMLRYGTVAIDLTERYDKHRHHLNRMDIVGTNGVQTLSASLEKPNRSMPVAEIRLSAHGNWRHNHWGALFSAYGRTPFFDYFADDLKKIYADDTIQTIADLNMALHSAIIDFLALDVQTVAVTDKAALEALNAADMRDGVFAPVADVKPYYQIWSQKLGFQPHQSILDLLFNLGREAIFILK